MGSLCQRPQRHRRRGRVRSGQQRRRRFRQASHSRSSCCSNRDLFGLRASKTHIHRQKGEQRKEKESKRKGERGKRKFQSNCLISNRKKKRIQKKRKTKKMLDHTLRTLQMIRSLVDYGGMCGTRFPVPLLFHRDFVDLCHCIHICIFVFCLISWYLLTAHSARAAQRT